jgi:hypothetical protein
MKLKTKIRSGGLSFNHHANKRKKKNNNKNKASIQTSTAVRAGAMPSDRRVKTRIRPLTEAL